VADWLSEELVSSIPVLSAKKRDRYWLYVVESCATRSRFFLCIELPIQANYNRKMIKILQDNYYTVTQAAELAGVTVSYVRQLLRTKKIRGEKFGERAWVIPANQLEKLRGSPTGKQGRTRIGQKK